MGDSPSMAGTGSLVHKAAQGPAKQDGSIGLLETLESSLDDIRSLIVCRICVRPLFEPYTIECGHTFCYGCLAQWFEKDRRRKTCPDCRADVVRQPAPAYLVRDMTQIFASRAELMPSGETTEDHKKWKEEEAALVESDRSTSGSKGGLFRGCFKNFARRPVIRAHPIRDAEDGVERCPACTWELEDGVCESCGYSLETETDLNTDSEDMEYDGGSMDDEILEALAEEDLAHQQMYGGGYYGDREMGDNIPFDMPPAAVRRRAGYRIMHPEIGGLSPNLSGSPPGSFYDGTNYGSGLDDDGSSLDGFVVDDDPHIGRVSPQGSPGSLQWETDEGSGPEENQAQDSDYELNNHADNDSVQNEPSFGNAQYNSEDDSDQGPIAPLSRRQRVRPTFGSSDSEASQPATSIRNRSSQNFNHQRSIPHRSTAARRGGGRSRGVPIEIASESDSPAPPQQQRRRGGLTNRILSDDDTGVDASSGTATLGRQSPRPCPRHRNQRINRSSSSQASNALSPIHVVSDAPVSENEGSRSSSEIFRSFPVVASLPERPNTDDEGNQPRMFAGLGAHSLPHSPPTHITSPYNHLSPHSQSNRSQNDRLQSPLPPRPHRHGSSRPSISPMRPEERFQQGVRDRAAAKAAKKAERRRLKAERDQRQSAHAGPSNISS